jgi:hypothetical protein
MRRLKGIAISPKITFQAIAGGATINQIFQFVCTTGGARSKMIDLQLAARFLFVYATVAATTTIGATNHFTAFLLDHRTLLR